MGLLETINSPQDLKKLPVTKLPELAQEIREFLIQSVSKTGGHIGPSLGVVELTLALHYIFSTPKDKLVWDVGHQAYTHKILTGRRDKFDSLRQYEGISGFPHITENEHDAMTVGHSSTSISAALGMAQARDLLGKDGDVVAIIGDGAMTGGLAYEGMNNLGHSDTKMTIILNDNEMSIAPNVGGMSNYLTKVITDKKYTKIKSSIWNFLDAMPKVGKPLQKAAHNVDDAVKKALTPGKLFEDMGIKYLGPIDGHNLEELLSVLAYAKDENRGPLLIHVITQKGKGYHHAENNATKFHGLGSFDIETGEVLSGKNPHPSWSAVFGSTMEEIVEKDKSVVALTAAMPTGTGLGNFQKKFPKNLIDVGIAEQHAVTSAAGLCLNGMKPVFAVYSTFLQRAFDQLVHDVALENLNVVFCIDRAGIVGQDGPTHHGCLDISYLSTIPNMTILTPSSAEDLKDMLYSAIYEISGPVCIRYPRGNASSNPIDYKANPREIFAPILEEEEGENLILNVGSFYEDARATYELLKKDDCSVAFGDLRCVKPLNDDVLINWFNGFNTIITMEHNSIVNGAGNALLAAANRLYVSGAIESMPKFIPFGYPDHFIEQGSINELMAEMELVPVKMAKKIKELI